MIIVITGPTGIGKTKLSIKLAKEFNAEIINGDSVQIYKGLNIGSAKITEEEKEGIPHHLFDIREVTEEYSLYDYQKDARKCIDEIQKRNKNVIIVGGSALYIKSVLYDYTLSEESNIKDDYDEFSTEELYEKLIQIDKDINIDKNNRRRVVRALNYYKENNSSISLNKNGNNLLYNAIFIGLTTDRNKLYERTNNRVDKMMNNGLLKEVKTFHDKKICSRPLLTAISYKELYLYLDGKISLEEAIELIKRNNRRYAKRQYTFFNNQFNIKWFNVDFDNFNKTIEEVIDYIKNKDHISRI